MLSAPAGRGFAPRPRAARNPRPHPADHRRIQLRRPVSAIPRPVGRRPGQGGMVQALSRERTGRSVSTASCRAGTPPTRRPSSAISRCARPGACKGKDLFLLGLFRRRLEYPALKRAVREQQSLFDANDVLIEDKASGTQLIQELITDGCHGVTRYQPTSDKIMRLHAQTAMIENGFVHIPESSAMARRIPPRADGLPQGQARRPGRTRPRSSSTGSRSLSRARDTTSGCGCEPSACRTPRRTASAIGFS